MMLWKKWIKKVFFICIVLLALLMTVNYIVNPFNVFNSKILKYPFQVNERFAKIEYLSQAHHKYNSYMFGSSRIGTTSPAIIEKYMPGSKFYNFTISTATQVDHYKHLNYMVKHHFEIKNIYLQIDIKDFLIHYKPSDTDFLRKTHPSVTGENKWLYYLDYLTILPMENIKKKLKINFINHAKAVQYDMEGTGQWYVPYKDKKIEENQTKYIQSVETLNINKITRKHKNIYSEKNSLYLKKFLDLCKENKINCIVFTTPHNYNMMNNIDFNDYLSVLKDIAQLTPFWDFSGYNSITCDNYFYYEKSHYLEGVGKLISEAIFEHKKLGTFGTYVTSDNVERVLKNRENVKNCVDVVRKKGEKN